jgi:hypothetical protein
VELEQVNDGRVSAGITGMPSGADLSAAGMR